MSYARDKLEGLMFDVKSLLEAIERNIEQSAGGDPVIKLQYILEEIEAVKEVLNT